MLPLRETLETLLAGLEFYLNTGRPPKKPMPSDRGASETQRPCRAVPRNTTAKVPPYPYLAYEPTTLMAEGKGTYSENPETGKLYRPVKQTISLTIQSDRREEVQTLAMAAHDFFEIAGCTWLADQGIVVGSVGPIASRDNLVTIEYERRQGFDFTLLLINHIKTTKNEMGGWIDRVTWP